MDNPVVVATLAAQVVARDVNRLREPAGWPGEEPTLSLTQSSPLAYDRYAPSPRNFGPAVLSVLQGFTAAPSLDAVQVNVTLVPDTVTPVIPKVTLSGLS